MPHIDTGPKWKKHFLFTNWFAFKCVHRMSKSLPLVEKYKSSRHPTRVKAAQFVLERQGGGRRTLVYSTGELGSGWQGGRAEDRGLPIWVWIKQTGCKRAASHRVGVGET